MSVAIPSRSRVKVAGSSRKSVAIKYFVKIRETKYFKVQVCQNTFKDILQISKDRTQRIGRVFFTNWLAFERKSRWFETKASLCSKERGR